ncbi:MAG: RING-HC finger protein [Candidatus Roizmanbacteria bacterium]
MAEDMVRLQCVKEGGKLRVRIISPGYNRDANCQFPRAIRADGREYEIPRKDISFSEGAGRKFFYRIKKTNIKVVELLNEVASPPVPGAPVSVVKIYGDEDEDKDCAVCMSVEKDVIIVKCGHYIGCFNCIDHIRRSTTPLCPICRQNIEQIVKRSEI